MILNEEIKKNILKKFQNKKIAVLYGGISEEREVSLRSGENVYKALTSFEEIKDNCILIDVKNHYELVEILKKEKVEYCYNILHGSFGEDGSIQGLLDCLNIKYTGENTLVSSVCMNKVYTKRIWQSSKVPTADFILLKDFYNNENNKIVFPLISKPISNGSSVGVSLIKTKKEFEEAIKKIEKISGYFIEPYIKGKEITVGLVRENNGIFTLPILGINTKNEIYDYDAKYTPGKTELEVPAKIDKKTEKKVIEVCSLAYEVLGCEGLCRIDAIIDENNKVYLMEVNTQGGMTNTSDIPAMAKSVNIEFEDIVLYVLNLCYKN
ncbi:D-alanine--D-alanine ligase [Brachyspira aalborgi]|uniref:D-alanine--D-alanine ligase n=1 Tax=Brachyspira aalborgi TaxID=29522 RepID=A0A5C8EM25_9SPIR|nr:D-alanine--D-alanine ligase [Brachyspira aalborgi]TXJ38875.1 D-alanine--D-alanine ligase [Brachyspira aalborgi]TXJ50704.1 D-alanine--D-alanine ligase [Brachyspira aalborgi]